MNVLKNEKGFTLIELVLIIVILGILAAVAIVQFGTLSTSARDSAIDGAFGSYQSALAISVGLCRGYPSIDNSGGDNNACDPTTSDTDGDFCNTVYNQVALTQGMTATACTEAATVTFDIESGTAGTGRTATATYTVAASVGTLTLGAKSGL